MKRQLRTSSVELTHEIYLELPLEVWQEVFSNLSIKDLFRCNRVCHSFGRDLLYKSVKSLSLLEMPSSYRGRKIDIDPKLFINVEHVHNCQTPMLLETISLYPHLKSLVLCNNMNAYIHGLHLFTRLESLTFKLESIHICRIPNGLSCLTNLTKLDVSLCGHVKYDMLKPLQKLVSLTISDDQSGVPTQESFSSLTTLKKLEIHSSFTVRQVRYLPVSLEYLSLHNASLGASLANLTNLTVLKSYNSNFDTKPLALLTNLTRLSLSSSFNQPSHIPDNAFTRLTQLTSLDVNNSVNVSHKGLANLVNLRTLRLCYSNPQVHNLAPTSEIFTSLTNLTTLALYHEFPVIDEYLSHLSHLSSLSIENCLGLFEKYYTPVIGTRQKIQS